MNEPENGQSDAVESVVHTPGPWAFELNHSSRDPCRSVPSSAAIRSRALDERLAPLFVTRLDCVLSGYGESEERHSRTMVANAQLIAAAPELLECLQGFIRTVQAVDPGVYGDAIDEAEAVIAKATGKLVGPTIGITGCREKINHVRKRNHRHSVCMPLFCCFESVD